MSRRVVTRVGHALLSMFALYVLVFGLMRLTGDPVYGLLGPEALPEDRERVRIELGLDQPTYVQFIGYMQDLARGDLGTSFRNRVPVTDLLRQRLPITLQMGAAALLLTVAVGLPVGVYSAYWRGGRLDMVGRFFAALGQAMPSFWVGLLLILVFAVNLQLVPAGFHGGFAHFVLPTVTLAFGAVAGLIRLLRSSMIEALESDYISFHRMKGLPEHVILWKHALRNAGQTSLSYVGILTAGLFTGSVVIETVFVWPGVGRLMVDSIGYRDIPVLQGCMLLFSTIYIGLNLLVDLLYVVLNPRLH